jgi:hypothetical protein
MQLIMNKGDIQMIQVGRQVAREEKGGDVGRSKKRARRERCPVGSKEFYMTIKNGCAHGGHHTENGGSVGEGEELEFECAVGGDLEKKIIGGKGFQKRETLEAILKLSFLTALIESDKVFSPGLFK